MFTVFGITFAMSKVLLGIFFFILALMFCMLQRLSSSKTSNFNWSDLVIDPITGDGSLTKVLQLLGGLTGTFIVIWQTIKALITPEMFIIYMGALGVSEAFSRYIAFKYGKDLPSPPDDSQSK